MIAATSLVVTVVVPLIVALLAGGGVAIFTAKPHRESIIAAASKNAVDVVNVALSTLEADNGRLRRRVGMLERHVARLSAAISNLGGNTRELEELFELEDREALR